MTMRLDSFHWALMLALAIMCIYAWMVPMIVRMDNSACDKLYGVLNESQCFKHEQTTGIIKRCVLYE